jgi:predicted phage-related endonuclease
MKVQTFTDRDSWLIARRGKITGTRLKDIINKRGTGKKKGFYEIIAERVAVVPDGEDLEKPMDRGHRLEEEAIQRFSIEYALMVDTELVMWMRDDDENIAVSPDGTVSEEAAVEVKCLNSASHIEAWLTKEIPSEYAEQVMQYFVVNPKLKKLYFVFYDPRIPCRDFFVIEVKRNEEEVTKYLECERIALLEINEIVEKLQHGK